MGTASRGHFSGKFGTWHWMLNRGLRRSKTRKRRDRDAAIFTLVSKIKARAQTTWLNASRRCRETRMRPQDSWSMGAGRSISKPFLFTQFLPKLVARCSDGLRGRNCDRYCQVSDNDLL